MRELLTDLLGEAIGDFENEHGRYPNQKEIDDIAKVADAEVTDTLADIGDAEKSRRKYQ